MIDAFYAGPGVGLLVLYGRRRVGKSGRLEHWEETRFAGGNAGQVLNGTATTQSAAYQLSDFAKAASLRDPRAGQVATSVHLDAWEASFHYVGDLAELRSADGAFVVILDEFTYLLQSDESILNLFCPGARVFRRATDLRAGAKQYPVYGCIPAH